MTPKTPTLKERVNTLEHKLLRIEGEIFIIMILVVGSGVVIG